MEKIVSYSMYNVQGVNKKIFDTKLSNDQVDIGLRITATINDHNIGIVWMMVGFYINRPIIFIYESVSPLHMLQYSKPQDGLIFMVKIRKRFGFIKS